MADEKKESRISIEDLPQAEQALSTEEAKEVKGGTDSELPAVQRVTAVPGKKGGNVEFSWKVEEGES